MKIQSVTMGLRVKHPQYGVGTVRAISEKTADIRFEEGDRTIDPDLSGLTPAEPSVSISGLDLPLKQFVENSIETVLTRMGYEKPDAVIEELGLRWNKGKVVLHPADPTLQTKEVPLEVFFHKIINLRNQLRVLEQKINGHPNLSDGEKVEMQQYITRCYGSMTTFNTLFKEKESYF